MPDEQVKTLAEMIRGLASRRYVTADELAAALKAAIDERIDEKTASMKATLMFLTSEADSVGVKRRPGTTKLVGTKLLQDGHMI